MPSNSLAQGETVAIPGSTSGIWHDRSFPRLGIAKINVKMTPRRTDATGMVAAGGADLAVMPVRRKCAGLDFAGSIRRRSSRQVWCLPYGGSGD
jgi:hypothetical protein